MEEMTEIISQKRGLMEEKQETDDIPEKKAKLEEIQITGKTSQENADMEVGQTKDDDDHVDDDNDPDAKDDEDDNDDGAAAADDDDDDMTPESTFYYILRTKYRSITRCPAEDYFQKLEASTVFASFREALRSGNIEEFGHQLEPNAFSGFLVILCVHYYHKDENQDFLLKVLKNYLIGSECDIIDFTQKFSLKQIHQQTLQIAMWEVMDIFAKANEFDEPGNMVAETIADACLSNIWDVHCLQVLRYSLNSDCLNFRMSGLAVVTALAKLCKERSSTELSSMLHESVIVATIWGMPVNNIPQHVKKRTMDCYEEMGRMPKPTAESVAASGFRIIAGIWGSQLK